MMEELSSLKSLIEELTENPEKVNELTEEQVQALRRHNNPYGASNRNEDASGYVALSVTNLQEKFMERMFMVAYSSFIYRMREEYDLDDGYRYCSKKNDMFGEYVRKDEIKTELNDILIPNNNASLINRADDALREYKLNKMNVFHEFYNLHMVAEELRGELVSNVRKLSDLGEYIKTKMDEVHAISVPPTSSEDDVSDASDSEDAESASNIKKSTFRRRMTEIKGLEQKLETHMQLTSNSLNKFNDHRKYMETKLNSYIRGEVKRFINYYFKYNPKIHLQMDRDPIENDRYRRNLDIDPESKLPSDVFETFRLYKTANYDELIKEVQALWALKPELENVITVLEDGFQTEEEALEWKDKNKDIFTVQVHIVKKGSPYFIAAYEANRKKLEYYNKHTEILAAIEKRIKEDEKVGEKLLKKRVRRVKEANIEREGEDSEKMRQYIKENPAAAGAMGAQRFETLKEEQVLEIPVFRTDAKGMSHTSVFVEADGDVVSNIDNPEAASSGSAPTPSTASSNAAAEIEKRKAERLKMSQMPQ